MLHPLSYYAAENPALCKELDSTSFDLFNRLVFGELSALPDLTILDLTLALSDEEIPGRVGSILKELRLSPAFVIMITRLQTRRPGAQVTLEAVLYAVSLCDSPGRAIQWAHQLAYTDHLREEVKAGRSIPETITDPIVLESLKLPAVTTMTITGLFNGQPSEELYYTAWRAQKRSRLEFGSDNEIDDAWTFEPVSQPATVTP